MNIYKCLTVLILLTLYFVPASNAGEEIIKDGIVYVTNSDVPEQGTEILQLKKEWSVGGEDEEFIFRSVEQVLRAKDNNIYILDGYSDLIYVFDLAGKSERVIDFSGEIFRYGKSQIMNMFLKDDEIALVSKGPVQIICIDYFGGPGNTVEFPIILAMITQAGWGDGNLILGGLSMFRQEVFLSRFSIFGEVQIDYALFETDISFGSGNTRWPENIEYFWLSKPWDIDSNGRVYVAPNWSTPELESYFVEIYGHDDELKRVTSRKFEAYKRSQVERDMQGALVMGGYENFHNSLLDGDKYFEEEFEQDIVQIFAHPDGNVWLQTSRSTKGQPKGVMITYDVFSPQGHFIKQVSLLVDGDGERDDVYFMASDRIVIVKGQTDVFSPGVYPEADVLEIICYAVK